MQSLFDNQTHQEVLNRIEQLHENTVPLWGKMQVNQMTKHCQLPLEVANGTLALNKPNMLMKLVFKMVKPTMYNDKAWKPSLPTAKEVVVHEAGTFATEKEKLVTAINEFSKKSTNLHWPEHPAFGKFSTDQWGKMQYKHLDHHLKQFGV